MNKAKIKTFLIICATILSTPTWIGVFIASDSGNIPKSWEWFDVLLRFTWHGVPILVALTMLYVFISFLPINGKGQSVEFWLAGVWLILATICLIGVTATYLTAYKCGMNLINFLRTAPPIWAAVWAILITFMMITVSVGASLGKEDKKVLQSKSWNSFFSLAGAFIAIWTCILSTFGLTVWNILPACPK